MSGYSSIGLVRPKNRFNIGSVLRAAHCYGASLVATENARARIKASTDTQKAYRHIPTIRADNIFDAAPYGSTPIAVDLIEGAESLVDFEHPRTAFYIFGPEDGTLGKRVTDRCASAIFVPTNYCMNLAATVNVVLYDRMVKRG